MGSSSSTRRRHNLKPETDVGFNSYNYNPRPSITSNPAQPSPHTYEEYQQQRYQRQQQQQEQGTSRLNLSDPGYSSASAPIVSNRRASIEQKSAASVLRDEARARRLQKEEAAAAEERSRREAIRVAIPEQQQHILVVSARSASLPAIPTVARSSDNIPITNRSTRPISSSARSMPTRTHPSSTSTSTYSSSSSSSSSSARQSALRQQLQAMQTMGVPRSLQLSFLNSEGDLDESTFQRLVTLIEAQAPAVVRGASKEIVNSLPTTNFSSERSESIGTSCLICLEDFEEGMQLARLPVCLHSFHLQCIRCWLVEKANCPVCRTEVK